MRKYLRYALLTLLWGAVAAYVVYAGTAAGRLRAGKKVGRVEIEVVDSSSMGYLVSGRMVREFTDEELHAACGSSVRVKTADPARALALLEERLPGLTYHVEPDQAIVVSGGTRHAAATFGGASTDPAAAGAPAVEEVSRVLHETDQVVLELTVLERDIEDYFVELMDAGTAAH